LILALMEMVINGVSTRKVAKITEELCGTEFSKSAVSELCKRLDPLVKEWNDRPLKEAYQFVMVNMRGYREVPDSLHTQHPGRLPKTTAISTSLPA